MLNTWILWWNAQNIPLTESWWNAPVMAPLPGALALSEHLLGLSVFATPIQLAGGSPLTAYSVTMVLTYALSGFFAYLLAFRLTGSIPAAACAGMAFAFAPYRAGQLSHIQVLSSQWMPAILYGMHAYFQTGERRWLVVFGACWLLQALSNGYYLLFVPVLLLPAIAWFADWRGAPRRPLALVFAWALASLPLVPILLKYYDVHSGLGLERTMADVRQFSATLKSFTYAPPLLRVWPSRESASTAEDWLFPGLTIVVLTVLGVVLVVYRGQLRNEISRRSALLFYSAAALVMFWLTLGPGGDPGGPASPMRPYTWLMALPGYDGLRVPSRFAMLGELCLAIAASITVARLSRGSVHRNGMIAALALAGICCDGVMEAVPLSPPPQRITLNGTLASLVIEVPPNVREVSVAGMYRAMYHRKPLVNGYSGYIPYHYSILSDALWRGDPSVLSYLARDGPLAILVDAEADADGGFRRMVAEIPGAEPQGVSGAGALFLLPQQRATATTEGTPLAASVTLTTEDGRQRVVADLGAARLVSGIELALGRRFKDLDRRILIEVSGDARQWREGWLGWTGEFALDAALRDPERALVRIPIPATHARFVRLYPAASWMAKELAVIGK